MIITHEVRRPYLTIITAHELKDLFNILLAHELRRPILIIHELKRPYLTYYLHMNLDH